MVQDLRVEASLIMFKEANESKKHEILHDLKNKFAAYRLSIEPYNSDEVYVFIDAEQMTAVATHIRTVYNKNVFQQASGVTLGDVQLRS